MWHKKIYRIKRQHNLYYVSTERSDTGSTGNLPTFCSNCLFSESHAWAVRCCIWSLAETCGRENRATLSINNKGSETEQ
jgi:hypothetical protein